MNLLKTIYALIINLFLMTAAFTGCTIERADQASGETEWVPADQLKVTEQTIDPERRIYLLLDTSASNTLLSQVKKEVGEISTANMEGNSVKIVPIRADSHASSNTTWNGGPVQSSVCTHPPVKEEDFYNKAEETAYTAAAASVQKEMAECTSRVQKAQEVERSKLQRELRRYLGDLQLAPYTDIEGALARVSEFIRKNPGTSEIVIFSDMEQDLIRPRDQALNVQLHDANVIVRYIQRDSYASSPEEEWRKRLMDYGVKDVDWSVYSVGAADIPTNHPAAAPPKAVQANTPAKKGAAKKKVNWDEVPTF